MWIPCTVGMGQIEAFRRNTFQHPVKENCSNQLELFNWNQLNISNCVVGHPLERSNKSNWANRFFEHNWTQLVSEWRLVGTNMKNEGKGKNIKSLDGALTLI